MRNEERWIASCLTALARNSYPHHLLEVLVVDGMSEDRTRQIAGGFAGERWQLRVIPNPRLTRPAALNLGIGEARGQVILRLDARTLVPPDYVSKCVETLRTTGADNVGGVQKPISTTPMQEAIGLAMATPFGVGNAQFRLGRRSGFVDTVYLGCYRREVFDRLGLFDDRAAVISEEGDMNQRINQSGGRVYLNTAIQAGYYPRERLREQARVYFRYGGSRMGTILKNGGPTSFRQLVAPAFLVFLIILGIGAVFHPWPRIVFSAGAALYLTCDLGISASLALRHKKPGLFPRLFITFPCMHFPYALGFLKRLVQRPKPGTIWPH